MTNQFIEANRDCVEEYEGQRSSIFASLPLTASLVAPALTRPDEIVPDDPDPPKNVDGVSGGGSSGGTVLEALQNQTDATVGRDVWLCSASARSFNVAYLFVGDRGLYVQLTGDENDPPAYDFDVTVTGADTIRLVYPEENVTETISNLTFTGSTLFSGSSDVEGTLECARTPLDAQGNEGGGEPPPSGDALAQLYGTTRFAFLGSEGQELALTVAMDASGRDTLEDGTEVLGASDAGAAEEFVCAAGGSEPSYLCIGILSDGGQLRFYFTLDTTGNGSGVHLFCPASFSTQQCSTRFEETGGDGPVTVTGAPNAKARVKYRAIPVLLARKHGPAATTVRDALESSGTS